MKSYRQSKSVWRFLLLVVFGFSLTVRAVFAGTECFGVPEDVMVEKSGEESFFVVRFVNYDFRLGSVLENNAKAFFDIAQLAVAGDRLLKISFGDETQCEQASVRKIVPSRVVVMR